MKKRKGAPYQLDFEATYGFMQLDPGLGAEGAGELEKEAVRLRAEDKNLVISCRGISNFPPTWVRSFMALNRSLNETGLESRFVLVSRTLARQLQAQGVDGVLRSAAGVKEALDEFGVADAPVLDVGFVNPFIQATLETLKLQANVSATLGRVYRKGPSDRMPGDISAVVEITSVSFTGLVAISFPEATFINVISAMLGEPHTSITPDIAEGVGELSNVIFCRAKSKLNKLAYGLKLGVPSLILGQGKTVPALLKAPIVVAQFESEAGSFYVEICISR